MKLSKQLEKDLQKKDNELKKNSQDSATIESLKNENKEIEN